MNILLAVGAGSGAVLATAALVGLVARRILLPWLREELSTPLAEVRYQVTNDHKTNLRDDITSLGRKLDAHMTHAADMDAALLQHIADRKAHP